MAIRIELETYLETTTVMETVTGTMTIGSGATARQVQYSYQHPVTKTELKTRQIVVVGSPPDPPSQDQFKAAAEAAAKLVPPEYADEVADALLAFVEDGTFTAHTPAAELERLTSLAVQAAIDLDSYSPIVNSSHPALTGALAAEAELEAMELASDASGDGWVMLPGGMMVPAASSSATSTLDDGAFDAEAGLNCLQWCLTYGPEIGGSQTALLANTTGGPSHAVLIVDGKIIDPSDQFTGMTLEEVEAQGVFKVLKTGDNEPALIDTDALAAAMNAPTPEARAEALAKLDLTVLGQEQVGVIPLIWLLFALGLIGAAAFLASCSPAPSSTPAGGSNQPPQATPDGTPVPPGWSTPPVTPTSTPLPPGFLATPEATPFAIPAPVAPGTPDSLPWTQEQWEALFRPPFDANGNLQIPGPLYGPKQWGLFYVEAAKAAVFEPVMALVGLLQFLAGKSGILGPDAAQQADEDYNNFVATMSLLGEYLVTDPGTLFTLMWNALDASVGQDWRNGDYGKIAGRIVGEIIGFIVAPLEAAKALGVTGKIGKLLEVLGVLQKIDGALPDEVVTKLAALEQKLGVADGTLLKVMTTMSSLSPEAQRGINAFLDMSEHTKPAQLEALVAASADVAKLEAFGKSFAAHLDEAERLAAQAAAQAAANGQPAVVMTQEELLDAFHFGYDKADPQGFYDAAAKYYDEAFAVSNINAVGPQVANVVADQAARAGGKLTIYDPSLGTGAMMNAVLAKAGLSADQVAVLAGDLSTEMLDQAATKGYPWLNIVGRGQSYAAMAAANGSVDLVMITGTLARYGDDFPSFVSEAWRVLKPGGSAVFELPANHPNYGNWIAQLQAQGFKVETQVAQITLDQAAAMGGTIDDPIIQEMLKVSGLWVEVIRATKP